MKGGGICLRGAPPAVGRDGAAVHVVRVIGLYDLHALREASSLGLAPAKGGRAGLLLGDGLLDRLRLHKFLKGEEEGEEKGGHGRLMEGAREVGGRSAEGRWMVTEDRWKPWKLRSPVMRGRRGRALTIKRVISCNQSRNQEAITWKRTARKRLTMKKPPATTMATKYKTTSGWDVALSSAYLGACASARHGAKSHGRCDRQVVCS